MPQNKTAIGIASDFREMAQKYWRIADILDPPEMRKQRVKERVAVQPKPAVEAQTRSGMVVNLGTAGHTTAGDKDAKQIANDLAYTTEEPA